MRHLIEYIGKDKLITTDLELNYSRWRTPRPGDVVDFALAAGKYPFDKGQYGTLGSFDYWDNNKWEICCHMGSIFLGESNVSISGGPFSSALPCELTPSYQLRTQTMWNWGNNSAGADMGVYYQIDRPVFYLSLTN